MHIDTQLQPQYNVAYVRKLLHRGAPPKSLSRSERKLHWSLQGATA